MARQGKILVLYKVVNSGTDPANDMYNAFEMPRSTQMTLSNVKRHCTALHSLSHAGPDGYHWRVRVDEKKAGGSGASGPAYSWWDVQDENACLPIKSAPSSEISKLFGGKKSSGASAGVISSSTNATKAFKMIGKAVNQVAKEMDGLSNGGVTDDGPMMDVISFKLLDLCKIQDAYESRQQSSSHASEVRRNSIKGSAVHSPRRSTTQPLHTTPQPGRQPQQRPQQHQQQAKNARPQKQPSPPSGRPVPVRQKSVDLMTGWESNRNLNHSASMPVTGSVNTKPQGPPKSRVQKLSDEYKKKKSTDTRVWDAIDERWVTVDPGTLPNTHTSSAPPGTAAMERKSLAKKAVKGISIDARNAVGKSANVQAGVHQRVNEMNTNMAKAKQELRDRETKKAQDANDEDEVRKRLEPRVKKWGEEYGKKKQLRALLAGLHMILWKDSGWKQVTIGDIVDEKKARRCYLRATLKVHPDKTRELDAEKRFIAKRVFDSLSQAHTEFNAQSNK